MLDCLDKPGEKDHPAVPSIGFCMEKNRLLDDFLTAIRQLIELQEQQTRAVIEGDPDFCRFDFLLHVAQENKDRAKYLWMLHVDSHGCGGL
ncbi:MAG: hypothetical protein ABI759_23765 [Candidatus Solibacter sp.]